GVQTCALPISAAPAQPPPPPPDAKKSKNAHDYYVDLMKSKLAGANSINDVYNIAQDVFQKMEDNKTDDGKNNPHHCQEKANDHEHSRTRKDLKQLVAAAIQQKGGDPGAWGNGQDDN